MAHVFISYSRKDDDYVAKLASSLEERGIDVWMDDEIDYGDRYPKVIQEHLDSCGAVVLVMSEHSQDSERVANELAYAKDQNKAILPLLLNGRIWLTLATTQHADVSHGDLPPDEFFDRLRAVLDPVQDRHEEEPAQVTGDTLTQELSTSRSDHEPEDGWPQRSRAALAVQRHLAECPFVYLSPHIPARSLEGATKKLLPMAGPHDRMLALIDVSRDGERGVAIFETYFVYRSQELFTRAKRYLFNSLIDVHPLTAYRGQVTVDVHKGSGSGSRRVFVDLRNQRRAEALADFLNDVRGNQV